MDGREGEGRGGGGLGKGGKGEYTLKRVRRGGGGSFN